MASQHASIYLGHQTSDKTVCPTDLHPPPPPPTDLPLYPNLILCRPPHRKLKPNPPPRQLPINLTISIKSIIHSPPLLLIQHDLHNLTPILPCPSPLAHNLNGENQIPQDGVVDGRQCAAAWAFLRLRGPRSVGAFWAREDAATGEDEDVAVGEFLFKFAGEAVGAREKEREGLLAWDFSQIFILFPS